MKPLIAIPLLLFLAGCSLFQRPNSAFDYGLLDECENEECVVEVMDQYKYEAHNPERRYKFMEGCPPLDLSNYIERGSITISDMNDALFTGMLLTGSFIGGVAQVTAGSHGCMYSCKVQYLNGDKVFLAHELQHCQGYREGPATFLPSPLNRYTPKQKEIMKREGQDKWTDTDFFKYQIPVLYNYNKEELEWHERTWMKE